MKKYIFFLLFCMVVINVSAQEDKDTLTGEQTLYLLPDFVSGKVLFKNGATQQVLLNYNTLFQQMIFQQGGQMMAIGNIDAVDTVFIGDGKYVPIDTLFYEVKLEDQKIPYFILHTCKLKKAGQTGSAYSGVSATGAVRDVDLAMYRFSSATPYRLKLPVSYIVEHQKAFYIGAAKKMLPLKSAKQLKIIFPGKDAPIKDFITNNNISFLKETDIQRLLLFCNRLN